MNVTLHPLPHQHALWLEGDAAAIQGRASAGRRRCEARPVLLAPDDWSVRYMTEKNPEVVLPDADEGVTGEARGRRASGCPTGRNLV